MSSVWDHLSDDLTSLILSYLPLRSLLISSAVSRQFRLAATYAVHHPRRRPPWFFLFGLNNVVSRLDQSFAFDPESFTWISLPSPHPDIIAGSDGYSFATSACSRFSYSHLLSRGGNPEWRLTKQMSYNRCNPIVTVFDEKRFVLVGGSKYIGGLVDLEDLLTIEIYDPVIDSWEVGPPLPIDFRSGGTSSQWLSAALLPGKRVLFVFGIYSCQVAAFDLSKRVWTGVHNLRPNGALFAFLLKGPRDCLLLAGLCSGEQDNPNASQPYFAIWAINPDAITTPPRKLATMPKNLLSSLFNSDDDDINNTNNNNNNNNHRFASLKCVGTDGLIYVFNDDHHKGYPTCMCQIENDQVTWRMVPVLSGLVNRFHKTVAFCSPVPLGPILNPVN